MSFPTEEYLWGLVDGFNDLRSPEAQERWFATTPLRDIRLVGYVFQGMSERFQDEADKREAAERADPRPPNPSVN